MDGALRDGRLHLEGMRCEKPASMGSEAATAIRQALRLDAAPASSPEEFAAAVLARMRQGSFEGPGDHVETPSGLFFSRARLASMRAPLVASATGLRMAFGAPALLVDDAGEPSRVLDVGIFIGSVPGGGGSMVVG